jgi:death-on-curing protein
MRYVAMKEALHIHEALIKAHGGSPGVRDAGLIESALMRPRSGYYRDLIEEAAALWESLTMSHGFIDGNKRVAFACMEIFLDLNGVQVSATNEDAVRFIYRHLEGGTFNKDNLDAWLRENTKPV